MAEIKLRMSVSGKSHLVSSRVTVRYCRENQVEQQLFASLEEDFYKSRYDNVPATLGLCVPRPQSLFLAALVVLCPTHFLTAYS